MGLIHKLNKDIIPKIAAGEVIENPAGAVKELVENSLDAGASKIAIEVSGAGFESIRVTDDGCGLSPDDLKVCFEPFYTSKLVEITDLVNLSTLGFRGEALSSLCAVSSVTIKSRRSAELYGSQIDIREGKIVSESSLGMNPGTIVEVSGLFKNIPARLKFVRDTKSVFDKILEVFFAYALSYPDVSFSIYRDGKLIENLKKSNLERRISLVLGDTSFKLLLPIHAVHPHLEISGYIGRPQAALAGNLNQYIFVNKRYVLLKEIAKTVKSAYGTLIPHDVFPPFILYLTINPDLIDVNVHPKKHEIRFWDNKFVLESLHNAIKDSLRSADLTQIMGNKSDFLYDNSASSDTFMTFKDSVPLWKADIKPFILYETTFQINNTYIATPVKEGLLLVDQHAAHESILYNDLHKAFLAKKDSGSSFVLKNSVTIEFGTKDMSLLMNNLDLFTSFGFELYQSSPSTVTVSQVPSLLKDRDIQPILLEMLGDVLDSGVAKDLDSRSHKTLAFLACRSAVKAGDYLAPHEQVNILKKLDECNDIYTCPHGRPVKLIITSRELARFFKRIK